MKQEAESWPLQRPVLVTRALDMSLGPRCTDFACTAFGFAQFCVGGDPRALFLDRFSSPREGQIPDRFRQVWTGFRKNLPEPVRLPYLTEPGPNLTDNHPYH